MQSKYEIDINLTIIETECECCGKELDDPTSRPFIFTITDEDVREMSYWNDADFGEVKSWFCELVAFYALNSNEHMKIDSNEITRLVAFVNEHRKEEE